MLQILGTSQRARLKVIQENCFILTAFNRMVQNFIYIYNPQQLQNRK